MNDSSNCSFCGQAIIFRMMSGRCVPMHPEGGCPGYSSSQDDEKKKDSLYATSCPKCNDPVYFLRHNGGSTWLDAIPYPWPKHACFLEQSDPIPEAWQHPIATAVNTNRQNRHRHGDRKAHHCASRIKRSRFRLWGDLIRLRRPEHRIPTRRPTGCSDREESWKTQYGVPGDDL